MRSELDRGATFPVALPPADGHAPAAAATTNHESSAEALSVLIVDDEPFVRGTLAEMVCEFGHQVTEAESGGQAREMLAREAFHLVLTDLSMPDMDGWCVARAVRELQPAARTVLVTGYGAAVAPPAGAENLVAGVLSKPFNFSRIAEMLAEHETR